MSDQVLPAVLRVAGPAVLVVSVWSVWVRRLTFGSRYDAPGTWSVALFGVGSMLDSPWRQIAEASYPLTGRYHVLGVIGHLCYLAGAVLVVRAIYLRLLPDGEIDSFMSRRIKPLALGAAAMMLISFAVSEVSRSVPVDHLYLAPPDSLMLPYWIAHFGTATALGAIACYGVSRLRSDPRAVLLNVLLGALMTAALSGGLVVGWGVITGRIETLRLVAWLLTYAAFAAAAVGSAIQWRHRVGALVQLPD